MQFKIVNPLVLVFGLFFIANFSYAQSSVNTSEIEQLVEISSKYKRNPDSLHKYGQRILAISKPAEHLKGLLRGYYAMGYSNFLQGNYEKSVVFYDSALVHKEGLKEDYKTYINTWRNKAIALAVAGNQKKSNEEFYTIIEIAKNEGDYENMARSYSDLGVGYKNSNDYKTAIDLYQKAIRIYDSLGIEKNKTSTFLNIGIAQGLLNDYHQSNQSFQEVIQISKKYGNERDEYRAYNNLAVNLTNQKAYDSSLQYLYKLIPYYKKNKVKKAEYLAYQNIGKNYAKLNKIDSASINYDRAYRGYKKMGYQFGLGQIHNLKGNLLQSTEDHTTAIKHLDSSVIYAKQVNHQGLLNDNYVALSKSYEELNDFEKAHRYLTEARKLENETYTSENAKNLNEILTKHQVQEKDEEISSLSKSKILYQSNFYIAIVAVILICLLCYYYWKRNKQQNKELTELREELEDFQTERKQAHVSNLLHLKSKAILKIEQLMYVKSDGHYLEFYSEGNAKPEVDRNTLKEIKETLEHEGFAQIHKSYLLNLKYIRILNSTRLMLQDGTWLPLSRTYKPNIKKILLQEQENA
ncbi:LytTR family transcriptional regulator [Mesonia sp. K7]|uniref:LytTR family transcriptional regulator n=1 Tax=Mesonia sp. K7 TaxID=2218606 RepID=UPI000DA71465|nr:LytTR family transcriptional regulator [Mesonia sp. K7]PZD77024.1 hypothetical protein DNG35_10305 [Mesonia sp. K7]